MRLKPLGHPSETHVATTTCGETAADKLPERVGGNTPNERSAVWPQAQDRMPDRQMRPPQTQTRIRNRGPRRRPKVSRGRSPQPQTLDSNSGRPPCPLRLHGGGIRSRGPAKRIRRRGEDAKHRSLNPGFESRPLRGEPRSPAEGVGFEPTRPSRVNALAGRRLKPLGHPSDIAPPGIEPGLF